MVRAQQGSKQSYFFFNDTATTEIYTLSLHDALPISSPGSAPKRFVNESCNTLRRVNNRPSTRPSTRRSEEHTSELQSRGHLVCRLLLEKKKKNTRHNQQINKINQQQNNN